MPKPKRARGSWLVARGKGRKASSLKSSTSSLEPRASSDFLFEIGTEELPAAYLPTLIAQLGREAAQLLAARHLRFVSLEPLGTPRRLVLVVRGLAPVQEQPAEEIRGPSKQASFDEQGRPTQALLGFLKTRGGTLAQTTISATPKGEYVYLTTRPARIPSEQALPNFCAELIQRLRAPKTMRWDASGLRFARPIRWILARYGAHVIRCAIGACVGGDRTWIGAPKRPRAVRITSVEAYVHALRRAGVLLNPQERRQRIRELVEQAAAKVKGAPAADMLSHGLLDEVADLVEHPVALPGAFEAKYLELPRELLLASMAKYQRVFALDPAPRDVPGDELQAPSERSAPPDALLNSFVAILEGSTNQPARVRRMIEHILNARLADSLLFWTEDHRHLPLERMAAGLTSVTFHEQLGSMADKALRLRALCAPLAEAWQLRDEERVHLLRACQLSKADLVSAAVREFPTLQGVVGKYYALHSGEPRPVAQAIEEHYLPLGDRMPSTLIGSAVALLDKLDTLTGYFGLGIEPTGDQDPFGLRRAAQGLVQIAWAVHRPLPLDQLLRVFGTLGPLRSADPKKIATTSTRVHRYLLERLYTFEWPQPAPSTDCVEAVLSSPCPDLVDAMDRIRSLQQLTGHPGLLKAAKVIERTRNILRGAPLQQFQVDPGRFQDPLERQLWDAYQANEERLLGLSRERAYGEATTLFGETFFHPLHEFFERVLVNAPDSALQQNRLALMRAINTLYTERIADLSKLTILQREESPA